MNMIGLSHLEAVKYKFDHSHSCDWSEKPRPYATVAMMITGTGTFMTQNEAFTIQRGDMVFIPNGITYISHWQGKPNEYLSVHFLLEHGTSPFEAKNYKLQKLTGMDFESTLATLEKIRENLDQGGIRSIEATGDFFKIYSRLIPRLTFAKQFSAAVKNVQKAVDYLEEFEGNEITVGELAQMCHLSQSRFYTLFKQATGMSPVTYKNQILIRRGIQMLKNGMSIQTVSDELGFSSPSYFRRTFKQCTGKNPKEYIKSISF